MVDNQPINLQEKAQKWTNERKLDSALVAYWQIFNETPKDSLAQKTSLMNEIGHIYYLQDKEKALAQAIESCKDFMQKSPNQPIENQVSFLLNCADLTIIQYQDDSLAYYSKQLRALLPACKNENLQIRAALTQGFCYVLQAKYDSALNTYQQALTQYNTHEKPEIYGLLSQVYIAKGYIYDVKGELYETEQNYEKAYQTAQKLNQQNYFKEKAALYLANAKRKAGKYETALQYYQEALQFFEAQNHVIEITQSYLGIANVLVEKGEHNAAIEYYTKCLQVYQNAHSPLINGYDWASTYNNLSNAYRDNKDTAKAKNYLQKALQTYPSEADKVVPVLNLGVLYCFENQPDSAILYLKKTLAIDKEVRKISSFESAQALHWLGVAYAQKAQKTEALTAFASSLDLLKELGYEQSGEHGEIYEAMAEMYAKEKEWNQALDYVQKGLIHVSYQFKTEDYHTQPTLTGIASPMLMLKLLRKKGKFLYELYQSENKASDLVLCLNTRTLALDLVDSIRLDYAAAASKLSLMGEVNPLYESAIETALQLYDLQKDNKYLVQAFAFAERNKATVLHESLQSLKASESAHLPDSLVNKMNDLKTDIGYFEHQLYKANNPDSLKAVIVELKEKYQRIEAQMEEEYPDYHKIRYNFPKINLAEIQAKLAEEKRVLLSFFTGDSAIYGFCVSEKNIQVHKTPLQDGECMQQLENLRASIANNQFATAANPKNMFQAFCSTSAYLYQQFIQPFENQIANAPLLLLSDGVLSYLPFEVLIAKAPTHNKINYQDLPYLMKNHDISYAYSASLWLQPLQSGQFASKNYVAFAPSFKVNGGTTVKKDIRSMDITRGELIELTETRKEVEAIQQQIGGDIFTDAQATKARFRENIGDYKIIHLATHALLNQEQPMDSRLVFAPSPTDTSDKGFLYVYELFGMKLNAQMAVLSACNTGNGKLQRGEGVQSIARGFAYAGVPSVVMSLWPAQDAATSKIMIDFYAQLKKGKNKAEALRLAKQNFLENADAKVMAHPFFWAGFVVLGDTQSIDFEGKLQHIWYVIMILLGLLGGLSGVYLWKERRLARKP